MNEVTTFYDIDNDVYQSINIVTEEPECYYRERPTSPPIGQIEPIGDMIFPFLMFLLIYMVKKIKRV